MGKVLTGELSCLVTGLVMYFSPVFWSYQNNRRVIRNFSVQVLLYALDRIKLPAGFILVTI